MHQRELIAIELAMILRVIGHPDRLRIIAELSRCEKDVKTLLDDLELPGPRVSQHLSLLRAHRIVARRRDGRQNIYRLTEPELAGWVMCCPELNVSDARRDSKYEPEGLK